MRLRVARAHREQTRLDACEVGCAIGGDGPGQALHIVGHDRECGRRWRSGTPRLARGGTGGETSE